MTSSPFLQPRYDMGGFASIPGRIRQSLDGGQYERVILFLVDGFGWRFFEKFQDSPFFQRIARQGQVEKLTSQFPSTTAAHLTTLHTGLPVGEHGVFEWNYYEPTLDAVITPLLFSFAGIYERETLRGAGVKPRSLYPPATHYRGMKNKGISSTIFQAREYTPSTYSEAVLHGARAVGFRTLPEALVNLGQALPGETSSAFYCLYYDKIDGICHEYGPGSAQVDAEIENFLLVMEHIFTRVVSNQHKRTLVLLTADHGQVETDPKTTLYLNREQRFSGLERFLKTTREGKPIVPAGSARDFFLYIKDDLLEEARAFLNQRLEGIAEVRRVEEMIEAGSFGPVISTKFRNRVGNLVILPYRYESVWWYEKDKFEQRFYGHHGGLTPQELEIPFLSWEL